jgi:cell division protein FtsB
VSYGPPPPPSQISVSARALRCVGGGLELFHLASGANHGNRGLRAKVEYRAQANQLRQEQEQLKTERQGLERRIAMMRAESLERDILEEEARRQLGRVHRNDVVIFLKSAP